MRPLISVISPVYKSEKIVEILVSDMKIVLSKITENYEIVLVCDGSPDNSWNIIKKCCKDDKRIIGINLSRNFGQHYALSAGLKYSHGNYTIVIDCDLQDNPEDIVRMYKLAVNDNYDIIFTRRKHRKDGFLKRMSSKIYNSIYQFISGITTDSSISNFGLYSKKVIDSFNSMNDVSRSFQSLISYLGFKSTIIDTEHRKRYEGRSSYSLKKLLRLSEDIIIANSNRPLRIGIALGLAMNILSFVLIIYNICIYFTQSILPGFSSSIVSIWFVGGTIVMMLGIIGLYIDKIFNQVKNRPLYFIDEIINEPTIKHEAE